MKGPAGNEGELPPGFKEWQWGGTYTVRPDMNAPLVPGREYRIVTGVRIKILHEQPFTAYAELYDRAVTIANARINKLTRPTTGESLQTWVLCHGWQRIDIAGVNDLIVAFRTSAVVCLHSDVAYPESPATPNSAELMMPGGASADILQRINTQRMDEVYTEFDHRDANDPNDISMISYGEYVRREDDVSVETLAVHADDLARFHVETTGRVVGKIIRREWFAITGSELVVMNVYVQTAEL